VAFVPLIVMVINNSASNIQIFEDGKFRDW
jgi:hypothetical protein